MSFEEKPDLIDLKILEMLEKDSRVNLNQIAKECKLSSSAILTRIDKLKENGTIVRFILHVKHGTLGYPHQATVGIRVEIPQIESVIQKIRSIQNVVVCTKSIGKYNLMCLVIAQNMETLDLVINKIKNIKGLIGISVNIIIDQKLTRFEENHRKSATDVIRELDNIDKAIINELMNDSRLSFTAIAKKIKVSHETARKKFEKLKRDGIIKRCTIIIDRSKLGYQGTAFLFISNIQGSEKASVVNELKKLPPIYLINSIMGEFDIISFALFKNFRDLTKIVNDIYQIKNISQIDISFANFTYFSFKPVPRAPIECDTLELS